jgi:hypothetical protein
MCFVVGVGLTWKVPIPYSWTFTFQFPLASFAGTFLISFAALTFPWLGVEQQ